MNLATDTITTVADPPKTAKDDWELEVDIPKSNNADYSSSPDSRIEMSSLIGAPAKLPTSSENENQELQQPLPIRRSERSKKPPMRLRYDLL